MSGLCWGCVRAALGLCQGCVGAVLGSWVVMGSWQKKRAKCMSKKHVKNVGLFKGCVRAVLGLCQGCVGVLGCNVMGNVAKKACQKHVKNVGLFKGCARAVLGLCWLLGIGPRGLGPPKGYFQDLKNSKTSCFSYTAVAYFFTRLSSTLAVATSNS